MTEKIRVNRAVIVEGKYDKIKLSNIIDGLIIPTNGFSVFKDKALLDLIKKVAAESGLMIITDSDDAGMQIRTYLANTVGTNNVINVYMPKIEGKERRKITPSASGTVGVEGTPDEIIRERIKAVENVKKSNGDLITKTDLYFAGLSGSQGSYFRRKSFESFLGLPDNLSANYLLEYLNFTYTKDEFSEVLIKWQKAEM